MVLVSSAWSNVLVVVLLLSSHRIRSTVKPLLNPLLIRRSFVCFGYFYAIKGVRNWCHLTRHGNGHRFPVHPGQGHHHEQKSRGWGRRWQLSEHVNPGKPRHHPQRGRSVGTIPGFFFVGMYDMYFEVALFAWRQSAIFSMRCLFFFSCQRSPASCLLSVTTSKLCRLSQGWGWFITCAWLC